MMAGPACAHTHRFRECRVTARHANAKRHVVRHVGHVVWQVGHISRNSVANGTVVARDSASAPPFLVHFIK